METEVQKRERERLEDLQRLKSLRPIDDVFMRCIFKDNLPLVQKVLRIIINKPDLNIIKVETQVDMKRLLGSRSICLDALGEDESGKKYDIEVQRDEKGAGAHRARYHSSAMDIDNLNTGEEFESLPDTYVIFITEKDIYKKGLPIYPIERMNVLLDIPFNDGEHILYVNGAYRGDDEIGRLMHDFACSDPDDMLDSDMAKATRYYKENEEGVETMSSVTDELIDLGKVRQSKEIALNLIELGEVALEKIAMVTGLSLEEVKQLTEEETA